MTKQKKQSGQLQTSGRSVLDLLHRAGQQAADVFAAETSGLEVTARQFAVLQAINGEDGLSQTALVKRTGIDRSTIADIVRRMVTKGLIKRKRLKSDARVYAVSLTDKSKKILLRASPAARRADAQLLAPLTAQEQTRLIKYLIAITAIDIVGD
ncbi:MAG: MarR family transcriptional regulator [Pseudomonadota bacterium]